LATKHAATCAGVHKSYLAASGRVDALRGVDAEFPWAALTAVVGVSGSGKSSLLRVLAALDHPTLGEVLVSGHDVAALPPKALRWLRRTVVGYVFQRPADNFISYLTVGEHVDLAARSASRPGPEIGQLLDDLEIGHRRAHRPDELSGGEQQRAALAFALAAGPRVIVADEPTAELDSRSAEGLLRIILKVVESGVAVIVATHDRGVVQRADERLELEDGVVKTAAAIRRAATDRPRAAASSPGPPVLAARSVTKTYRRGTERVRALDDVSLALRGRSLAAITGRSGSGKTTLLNVLAGWERPESGEVAWQASDTTRDMADVPWSELALVPQRFGLMEELTVRENVEYPARLAGRLEASAPHLEALMAELGIDELGDRFPDEISVGQQQRVALARALALSPRAVLADEPTGHQDAASAERVVIALKAAALGGSSCLIATHNEELAARLDVVLPMANGRLGTRR
jgi:putative ABC transport system ATP-binding protein